MCKESNNESDEEAPMVILRDEKTATDTRFLSARLNEQGDLVIEGQDLGQGVKDIFDCIEYEWAWTIKSEHLPAMKKALSANNGILDALKQHFSDKNAANLHSFIKDHEIPHEFWSRIGD